MKSSVIEQRPQAPSAPNAPVSTAAPAAPPLPPPELGPPRAWAPVAPPRDVAPWQGIALGAIALLFALVTVIVGPANGMFFAIVAVAAAVPGVYLAWHAGDVHGDRVRSNLSGLGVALGAVAIATVVLAVVIDVARG